MIKGKHKCECDSMLCCMLYIDSYITYFSIPVVI